MISEVDLEAFGYYDLTWINDTKPVTVKGMVSEFRKAARQPVNPKEKTPKEINMALRLIDEEFKEFTEVPEDLNGSEEDLKELADLVYVIYGYAAYMGYDLDEAIRRVHENNMGRMKQPDGSIKYREDGKVIKNPDYPKVNLKGCY